MKTKTCEPKLIRNIPQSWKCKGYEVRGQTPEEGQRLKLCVYEKQVESFGLNTIAISLTCMVELSAKSIAKYLSIIQRTNIWCFIPVSFRKV